MTQPLIAVTMGDPAGIGPEIIARTFDEGGFQNRAIVVGDAAFRYVERATELASAGRVGAIATAPLNKEAMHLGGYKYPGHTEILAELTATRDFAMMLVARELRVIHVSTHVSLQEAIERVSKERVLTVIHLARDALSKIGVNEPRIAVAGLNPHAGEHGLFGNEDAERIAPAVAEAVEEGIAVSGPHPPDTVFARTRKEEFCEAQVLSSMEVAEIGQTGRGVPVYMDRHASKADGVVIVNRIKAHTDFRGSVESGLLKMASIGLGKHEAALELHSYGVAGIRDYMIEVGEVVFGSGRVLFGVGIVENAYDEPARIEAIESENVREREEELLGEYMSMRPALPVRDMDVLFVDSLGKNYSGTGMDTNVIGRFRILGVEEPESPKAKYVVVSRVSEQSHGNTLGVGLADLTTERLFRAINYDAM